MIARRLAAAAGAVALLAACSATAPKTAPSTAPETAPSAPTETATTPPAPLDLQGVWLPYSFEDSELIDPGWVTQIEYLDGVFAGAASVDGELEFTALSVRGETLWTHTRPAGNEGFALSRDPGSGEAIAVLTAQTGDDTTATAYDLQTGEPAWGPVAVPGPHTGPGLVFAQDAHGSRSALDPADGSLLATETEDARVLGEYGGTVLTTTGGDVVATNAAGELWRLDGPGWEDAVGHRLADAELALIGDRLIRLADGELLAEGVQHAVVDSTSRAVITLGEGTLNAQDAEGHELWTVTVAGETRLLAAGMGLLYLREGDAVRVHNVMTGQVAVGYDPDGSGTILVPILFTPEAAGLLLHGSHSVIATVPQEPTL